MTTDFALQLMGEMLLTALFISAPVLIPVMIVGLAISNIKIFMVILLRPVDRACYPRAHNSVLPSDS